METFMNGAIVVEAVVISVLVAVWMTWMGLRGLFKLMPVTTQAVKPTRFVADRQTQIRRSVVA
jgi:hypothetical protein